MPWIVSLGYDYLVDGKGAQAGLGSASLLLYFGVTYPIQRLNLAGTRTADRGREPAEHRRCRRIPVTTDPERPNDQASQPSSDRNGSRVRGFPPKPADSDACTEDPASDLIHRPRNNRH
jgi:hypothetical protein